jgi:hypothetical protein
VCPAQSPNELQDLLDATRLLLDELEAQQRAATDAAAAGGGAPPPDPDTDELREKFRIMKTVLEQGGQFAGINRKVQLKPLRWSAPPEEGSGEQARCVEALLILKHGGVLTHAGRQQAETLGNLFRNVMYPPSAGGGLLRLHSTYRHDLKIYSSGARHFFGGGGWEDAVMRVLSPAGLLSCLGMHSGGSEGRLAPDVPLGRVSALCRRGPRADQRRRLHQGAAGLGGGGADAHPGQPGEEGCGHAGRFWQGRIRRHPAG